jgi:hypothetical protein
MSYDGTLKSIDTSAMTLTLADGKVFHLPKGWSDPGLKADEYVTVYWHPTGGESVVTKVIIDQDEDQ